MTEAVAIRKDTDIDAARVVTKAIVKTAKDIGLSGTNLAKILGLSESSISRLKSGSCLILRDTKAYEISLIFLRIYRGVSEILSGDMRSISAWFRNQNNKLGAVPIEKMFDLLGLISVLNYVEEYRAKA